MTKFALSGPLILLAFLAVGPQAVGVQQEPLGFGDLIEVADAVVAVEVLSTDYTATASDGPMSATAKVLKVVKGPFKDGSTLNFMETAWVGPAYQKGEYRILFLEKTKATDFPKTTEWRILTNSYARTDFFINKDSIARLSPDYLKSFLREIQDLKTKPKKVTFR
jgi:hypothetical protein